jgi:hypothetical protein
VAVTFPDQLNQGGSCLFQLRPLLTPSVSRDLGSASLSTARRTALCATAQPTYPATPGRRAVPLPRHSRAASPLDSSRLDTGMERR